MEKEVSTKATALINAIKEAKRDGNPKSKEKIQEAFKQLVGFPLDDVVSELSIRAVRLAEGKNIDELIAANPDVVFPPYSTATIEAVNNVDFPVLMALHNNNPGELLGGLATLIVALEEVE